MVMTENGREVDREDMIRAQPEAQRMPARALVSDLAHDVRHLLELELEAARLDVRQEIDKAKTAAVSAGTGGSIAAVGGLMLVFALVYVLATYTALALWGSFAIVGGALIIIGGIALMFGRSKAQDIEVPGRRTAAQAREDVRWIKDSVSATR